MQFQNLVCRGVGVVVSKKVVYLKITKNTKLGNDISMEVITVFCNSHL